MYAGSERHSSQEVKHCIAGKQAARESKGGTKGRQAGKKTRQIEQGRQAGQCRQADRQAGKAIREAGMQASRVVKAR